MAYYPFHFIARSDLLISLQNINMTAVNMNSFSYVLIWTGLQWPHKLEVRKFSLPLLFEFVKKLALESFLP